MGTSKIPQKAGNNVLLCIIYCIGILTESGMQTVHGIYPTKRGKYLYFYLNTGDLLCWYVLVLKFGIYPQNNTFVSVHPLRIEPFDGSRQMFLRK